MLVYLFISSALNLSGPSFPFSHGFAEEEARARHDTVFDRFSLAVLGNSSAEISTDDFDSDAQLRAKTYWA
jgi:hypothetical protein